MDATANAVTLMSTGSTPQKPVVTAPKNDDPKVPRPPTVIPALDDLHEGIASEIYGGRTWDRFCNSITLVTIIFGAVI